MVSKQKVYLHKRNNWHLHACISDKEFYPIEMSDRIVGIVSDVISKQKGYLHKRKN